MSQKMRAILSVFRDVRNATYNLRTYSLPPLVPPMYWGETGKSSPLPFLRGGLGRGKTIFDTQ